MRGNLYTLTILWKVGSSRPRAAQHCTALQDVGASHRDTPGRRPNQENLNVVGGGGDGSAVLSACGQPMGGYRGADCWAVQAGKEKPAGFVDERSAML